MDDKGPQGAPNKTGIQGMGSTWSYLQRRLLAMIFNIRIVGEDQDGRKPTSTPGASKLDPVKELKSELWALLKDVRGTERNWVVAEAWLRATKPPIIGPSETIAGMTAEDLKFVIEKTQLTLNPE